MRLHGNRKKSMIKIFAAFAVLTVMISTASVYNLKQTTYDLEEKKRDISAQILMDREAIKVLKAEMSYLSRPERLERLSRRHLALAATTTDQLALDVEALTVRDNLQMANLPVDNFQLLLPRQKPDPKAATRNNRNVRMVSLNQLVKQEQVIKPPKEDVSQKSLYARILAKIGN